MVPEQRSHLSLQTLHASIYPGGKEGRGFIKDLSTFPRKFAFKAFLFFLPDVKKENKIRKLDLGTSCQPFLVSGFDASSSLTDI